MVAVVGGRTDVLGRAAQEIDPRRAVAAVVDHGEPLRRIECLASPDLNDGDGILGEPSVVEQRPQGRG